MTRHNLQLFFCLNDDYFTHTTKAVELLFESHFVSFLQSGVSAGILDEMFSLSGITLC